MKGPQIVIGSIKWTEDQATEAEVSSVRDEFSLSQKRIGGGQEFLLGNEGDVRCRSFKPSVRH